MLCSQIQLLGLRCGVTGGLGEDERELKGLVDNQEQRLKTLGSQPVGRSLLLRFSMTPHTQVRPHDTCLTMHAVP